MLQNGESLPEGLTAVDIGCRLPENGTDASSYAVTSFELDEDIDYKSGQGMIGASRQVQRNAQRYWLYEYLARQIERGEPPVFNAIVLGCLDTAKNRYVVYLPEIGCEHKYLSQSGSIPIGRELRLTISSISPKSGLMTLILDSEKI